jgi:hypothetical protein
MLFRLIQKVADLWFSKEEDRPVVFVYQGEKDKIVLSSLTPTQGEESKKRFICETVIERRANEKIRAGFERLGEGYYSDPEILEPKRAELERLCAKGEISGYDLPYDILPKNLLDYVQEMRNQLGTLSKRTVDTLRWRGGIDGPPNPFSESFPSLSRNGPSTAQDGMSSPVDAASDFGYDVDLTARRGLKRWSKLRLKPKNRNLLVMSF